MTRSAAEEYPDDYPGRVRYILDRLALDDWSGAAVARELGVDRSQVHRWRAGSAPEDERALAALVGVAPALLRYGPLATLRESATIPRAPTSAAASAGPI